LQGAPVQAIDPASRIGITASRKVGNSVVRSRCKRLVREVFRHDPSWLPAGLDLVVIVRGGVAEMKFAEVLGEWRAVKNQLDRLAKRVLASA
jgi:ribonuclease P protein component